MLLAIPVELGGDVTSMPIKNKKPVFSNRTIPSMLVKDILQPFKCKLIITLTVLAYSN